MCHVYNIHKHQKAPRPKLRFVTVYSQALSSSRDKKKMEDWRQWINLEFHKLLYCWKITKRSLIMLMCLLNQSSKCFLICGTMPQKLCLNQWCVGKEQLQPFNSSDTNTSVRPTFTQIESLHLSAAILAFCSSCVLEIKMKQSLNWLHDLKKLINWFSTMVTVIHWMGVGGLILPVTMLLIDFCTHE